MAPLTEERQEQKKRLALNACPRCGGDLIKEEWLGDVDIVCIQCGYRGPTMLQPEDPRRRREPVHMGTRTRRDH